MRIFLAALFLAATWGLHSQSPEKNQQNLQTYSDPDAYEVYAALLPSNSAWGDLRAKSFVIERETRGSNPQGCLPEGKEIKERWADVIEDYKKQNETPRLLSRSFPIETPYRLISRTELSDLFGNTAKSLSDRWKSFYNHYPDSKGFTGFSAVGFNPDKTRALVYVGHHCGMLCGAGGYVFLEKRDGKWAEATVKASNCAWIS